jgi:phage tail tape-measure protein
MANWTGGAQGALGGASTGATIGSVVPGVGTAIGAGVGAVAGGLAGLFGNGRKKKPKRISSLDKRQQKLNQQQHDSILGQGPLADLYNYDPEAANAVFDKNYADPAYRKFKEDLAPEITGKFRSQGLMNSSYAGDALSKAARDIQESLDAKRSQFLYGEQSDARNAKRSAVEGLQNRQTFAYDKSAGTSGGFDLNTVLKSITPEMTDQLASFFKPKTAEEKT